MSSQPGLSLSSLLYYNKIRENAMLCNFVELTLICGQTTGNNEIMQLLFLNGHHLEPEVHILPTCVDSFLVQGTSYTSIPPSRIACTGRSMIAWHSDNAVIMCTAYKTSWREVKLQQRPHSIGQLFIKSFFVHQILMIRLSQHRKRGTRRGGRYLRWGVDNSERMLPYSLRFKNLTAKHSNRIWLEESWLLWRRA